ncbi:hypothetical protein TNCV_2046591 [Trichonephila clavipes]|uniref:Uncharacterized protein n=1 Tax=Trichonephila clavipes TaxID=2585209 RepID=A0A8X6SV58_TRICX|nr:hypothetical protein TNCV_2046591 [Trichonephila clavipes]
MLKKSNVLHGPLTSEELSEAERFWIQFEKERFFSEELKSLKESYPKAWFRISSPKKGLFGKNIIERSPWWGGFYGRLVRFVKESLHKILGKTLLSIEEMTTIVTEIEAVCSQSKTTELRI